MKKIFSTLILVAAAGFNVASFAATNEAKATYDASKDRAAADYKAAKQKCDGLKGNAQDICEKEAKLQRVRTVAEAEATYKNTDRERRKAREDIADAEYELAKEKCDDLAGNAKDVCVKEAKAAKSSAVADAKANSKVSEARKDAREDKKDADVAVQKEKCDALSGEAKDRCVAAAKAQK